MLTKCISLVIDSVYLTMDVFPTICYFQEMIKVIYMEDTVSLLKDTDISPGSMIALFFFLFCYLFMIN